MIYPSANNLAEPLKKHSVMNQASWSSPLSMIWLLGTIILLPVKIFNFPLNMELVDFWILIVLPFLGLSFILVGQAKISLSYTVAILFVLIGSFVSTFGAPNPLKSLIVILKEGYLFTWFVILIVLLCRLSAREMHRIMVVWAGIVILHGLLIITQFLSPDIWRLISGFGGTAMDFDHFRPSGLFISHKAGDANKAAFFQLLGYVPLLMAKPPKRIALFLGILLFLSMLATGSMAATLAFVAGLLVALIAIWILDKHLVLTKRYFVLLVVTMSFLGGLFSFVMSQDRSYQNRLEKIFIGRAERSSEGRFDLWQRGINVLVDHSMLIWGIGPENFRMVDSNDKQLHNDFLAFLVERGLLGGMGLVLFAGVALSRSIYLLQSYRKYAKRAGLEVIVFLAIIVAIIVESLTHQIFHAREMWLVLASQEAICLNIKSG